MSDPATSCSTPSRSRASRVVDLGRPLTVGMPQSPNHPAFWHAQPRRHGDMVRADGGSAANDMITMGTHVGTHIDALSHVSQDGRLHGGVDATRPARADGTSSSARTRSSRWSAAACCSTSPPTLGVDRLEAGYEITVADLEATRRAPGRSTIGAGDVVLVRSGWGQHFDDGDGDTFRGLSTGVPGVGEAGATLAGRAAACTPSAPTPSRSSASRPAPATALLPGPPGAARRARHLHHRDDGPRGARRRRRPRVPVRPVAAAVVRRHRLARPSARGGRRDERADPRRSSSARFAARRRSRTASPTTSSASVAAARARRARAVRRRAPAADQRGRARRTCVDQGGRAAGHRGRRAEQRCRPPQAAFVNGVLAHSLDYDDTHLPSVLHPSASVVPAALAAAEHAGRRAASSRPRDRRRARGRASGSAWPGTTSSSATRSSSSTASTPPRSAARWARAVAAALLYGAGRDGRRWTRSGSPRRWPSGVIEANRTGGTVKRLHCGWAAHAGVTAAAAGAARLHRPADRAGGPVRLLRGLAARRSSTPTAVTDGLGERLGGARASSSSPTRPTTSRTPSIDAGRALRERGRRARGRRVDRRSASPTAVIRTIGEPIEVKRAPETGYQAQFSGPYAVAAGLFGGGGLGARARRLHRRARPGPRPPRA